MDNQTHTLVTRFFKGAQRRNLPRAVMVPSWDLPLVLEALLLPPFEPLEQSGLTMALAKCVSELHALSMSEACMRWNSDGTGVALWPNPAFSQKGWLRPTLIRSLSWQLMTPHSYRMRKLIQ